MKRRILIFTVDLVPSPGQPTYGGGLRAWGLGQGLAHAGHEVIYSVPAELLQGREEVSPELARHAFQTNRLSDVIAKTLPDILLFEQWGLLDFLTDEGIPTVVDLHGSLILENSYRGQLNWAVNAEAKIRALRKADMVIVPGHRQADYFKPWLMLAGIDPRTLPIEVIPVSMPPEGPKRKKKKGGEPVFIHGGNLWPWIDPLPALEVVAETLDAQQKGKLMLFVGHPQRQNVLPQEPPPIPAPEGALASVLAHSRVENHGFVAHEAMIEQCLASHVAVDVYRRNAERELAITTRTLEYMWAGLPVIYADYAELSPIIAEAGAGWTVDPEDRRAIRAIVEEVLANPKVALDKGENARKLVAEKFTWEKTIGPLVEFCASPRLAGKGRTVFTQLGTEFEGLRRQWDGQRESLQNAILELSRETSRQGKEYDELKKAYEAHYRELRVKTDELAQLRQKHEAETGWRDETIRRLEQEKTDECKWRDDELRRRQALAAEVDVQHQAELAAKQDELNRLHGEMNEAVKRRDERYDALNDKYSEEIRRRDEELRMLGLERAKDIRDLNEQISLRDEKLNEAHADLKGIVLERDDYRRQLSELDALVTSLKADLLQARSALTEQVSKIEAERARLQTEVEKFVSLDDTLKEENLALLNRVVDLKNEILKLESELVDAHKGHHEALANVEAERSRLESDQAELSAKLVKAYADITEVVTERDALKRLASDRFSELKRLEKELDDTRTSDQLELSKIESERIRLQLAGERVKADLDQAKENLHRMERERDQFCGQYVTEQAKGTRMREEFERERQALIADRDGHRQALSEMKGELDRQRQHATNLEAGIAGRDDRIRWLEGVLYSLKNRLPNKVYKSTTYWLKRLVVQYPLLAVLYVLNFASNLYMQWWTQRHQQQVFPGM